MDDFLWVEPLNCSMGEEKIAKPYSITDVRTNENIVFTEINAQNLKILKQLDRILFPISYNESFYNKIVSKAIIKKSAVRISITSYYSFLIHTEFDYVGVCTFSVENGVAYIMTFGIMQGFRNRGIGTECLNSLHDYMERLGIREILLHVQTSNLAAKSFYIKNKYEILEITEKYYSNINPKSAFLLKKVLN